MSWRSTRRRETEIVDYAAVDDCGTAFTRRSSRGRYTTVHAIGAALHENFVYDEDSTLLTANFYDYHVPHALDLPPLKTGAIESPSPFTPLGAKGMGEGAAAASTASAPRSRTHSAPAATTSSCSTAATRPSACGRC